MYLERMPVGMLAANCYLIACEKTNNAAIVDPGGDLEKIMNKVNSNNFEVKYIILTHGHGDHIGATEGIKELTGAEILIHKKDNSLIKDPRKNLSSSINGPNISFSADKLVEDGDIIKLGELSLEIIHTPGHTPGGICIKVENTILSGDTLFANSIGRTDFEGGSFEEIANSIKNKLYVFDDSIKVFPGHGPATTLGIEKTTNPFVKA